MLTFINIIIYYIPISLPIHTLQIKSVVLIFKETNIMGDLLLIHFLAINNSHPSFCGVTSTSLKISNRTFSNIFSEYRNK